MKFTIKLENIIFFRLPKIDIRTDMLISALISMLGNLTRRQ